MTKKKLKDKKVSMDFSTISKLFIWFTDELVYFEKNGVFNYKFFSTNSPLIIVTGDNASGKSFIRRLVQSACKEKNIECIHLSQQGRCNSGIPRLFIYGAEDEESTGYNTANMLLMSFQTSKSRNNKHVLVYDEPDIGLSDEYAAGAGIRLRKFIEKKPKYLKGIVIMSHNRHILKELLPLKPNHLNLTDNKTLEEIVNRKIVPNVKLEKLQEQGLETWRKIKKILE